MNEGAAEILTDVERARSDVRVMNYALSHDLEAPLRGLKSLAKIMTQKHSSQLGGEAGTLVQLMGAEAEHASRLLAALVEWSRLGIQPISFSWQDTNEIAQTRFATVLAQFPNRKIEFRNCLLPSTWSAQIFLARVLDVVFSNALKFSGHRSTSIISISAEDSESETVVTVRDNGAGFDMAHTSQLFVLFRRLHGRKEFAGDGAGLAIAKRIIDLHCGRIWAEAEVDRGAAFHFALPKPFAGGSEHSSCVSP